MRRRGGAPSAEEPSGRLRGANQIEKPGEPPRTGTLPGLALELGYFSHLNEGVTALPPNGVPRYGTGNAHETRLKHIGDGRC